MKIFVQLGTLITFVQCSQNNGASIMVLQNKAHSTPVYFKISMAWPYACVTGQPMLLYCLYWVHHMRHFTEHIICYTKAPCLHYNIQ